MIADEVLTLFTTVLTKLVLVISEGTVEGSKFSKLVSLVVVLTFGCGGSLNVQWGFHEINQ